MFIWLSYQGVGCATDGFFVLGQCLDRSFTDGFGRYGNGLRSRVDWLEVDVIRFLGARFTSCNLHCSSN